MQQPEATALISTVPKPVKWTIPDTIRTDRATHLIVQQQGSEFLFLFFETKIVLFTGTPEEQIAAYQNLPELEAKCVAKIVMGVENALVAANNLVDGVNRFNMMIQDMKGQENATNTGTQENTRLSTASS